MEYFEAKNNNGKNIIESIKNNDSLNKLFKLNIEYRNTVKQICEYETDNEAREFLNIKIFGEDYNLDFNRAIKIYNLINNKQELLADCILLICSDNHMYNEYSKNRIFTSFVNRLIDQTTDDKSCVYNLVLMGFSGAFMYTEAMEKTSDIVSQEDFSKILSYIAEKMDEFK